MKRFLPVSLIVTAMAATFVAVAVPAQADSPNWANKRVLTCTDYNVGSSFDTFLTPKGWGSPFHVVGSTDVLYPVTVYVTGLAGYPAHTLTLFNPAFDHNSARTVHCTYTDPANLFVEMTAHLA